MSRTNVLPMTNAAHVADSIEGQMITACEVAIKEALQKYGCQLVFEQRMHNGMPVEATFIVVKKGH